MNSDLEILGQTIKTDSTNLYLCAGLSEIPTELWGLSHIKRLSLANNNLTHIPAEISNLSNLEELDLFNNDLTSISSEIGKLSKLQKLNLATNQLRSIPAEIGQLHNLEFLNLSRNDIEILPKQICNLTSLKTLKIDNNNISSLPIAIDKLSNLEELNLMFNRLTSLPAEINNLNKLKMLDVRFNPIEYPPAEIVVKGIDSIQNFFRQIEDDIDFIYEAKLIIVGEAGAGKTTLANKICDKNYQLKDENPTQGIEVIEWKFQIDSDREFKVNIWDFGGQEIYHSTHQFFLTKRSLYLLVADVRKEDTDFYYWCNLVKLLSAKSPLLIIKNEKMDRQREINEKLLRGEFETLTLIRIDPPLLIQVTPPKFFINAAHQDQPTV